MRILFWLLLLLGTAFGLVWMIRHDTGYVLINQFGYNIEISVVLALFVLLLTFVVFYWLFRLLGKLSRAPRDLARANERRAVDKAHQSTSKGYASLISGDWAKAEKQLMTNIDRNPTPMLNFLAAANAAHQRDDYAARDSYISKALEASPKDRLAIGLTKARLQYQAGQLEDSTRTLKKVQAFSPRNPRVLRLITEVGRASGDWESVLGVLPAARRAKALSVDELDELETEANRKVIALPAGNADEAKAELQRRFEALSSKKRNDPRIVETYVRKLLETDSHDHAEGVLRSSIKRNWDSELVYLYGLVLSSKPEQALKTAEGWTRQHPEDPDLLLTLGRLAVQNKIWGKARSYLESCIAGGGRDEAHRELGQLLEQLGETSEAMKTYRSGLIRMVSASTDGSQLLPAPISAEAAVEPDEETS